MITIPYIKEIINNGHLLSIDDIVEILNSSDEIFWKELFSIADSLRQEYVGGDVHLRGLIEFSNICKRDCAYCGLRKSNKNINRYRMPEDEIINTVLHVSSLGIKTVVLQSGEDGFYTVDMLARIIKTVKDKADIAITLSIGEMKKEEYKTLYDAGADRFLLRHETASPELYAKIHPDSDFNERMRCIESLFDAGFQVGMGCMVGIPHQTTKDMAMDIMLIQKYQPDMIGIGPFIANPDTPLKGFKSGTIEDTLKMVALARIVCPGANIPATTATGSIDPMGREKALEVGANVVMPNFTPVKYRADYALYPNKRCINEAGDICNTCIRKMITGLGRTVSTDYGHSYKYNRKKQNIG